MFWIKLGIVLAVLVALGFMVHRYNEALRETGRQEIRAEWAAAIEVQKAREKQAADESQVLAAKQEADRGKAYKDLATRHKALEAKLAVACVDPTLIAGMRDSVRTSNSESPRGPAEDPATTAGTPSGTQVNEWFATVTELYRACREQVIGWIKWDDARVAQ